MKLSLLLVAFVAALFLPVQAMSQVGASTSSDERIKQVLDQAKLKYTVDKDGDYKLEFELTDKRTQVVFVNSQTEKFGEFEIREVWSVGYVSDAPFSPAIANRLLVHNELTKLGAWQTKKLSGKYVAAFSAKVSATLNAEQLRTALTAVYRSADEIEKELTGKDDY